MDVAAAAAGQGAEEDTEQQNPDDSREDENRFAPTEGVHDATSRCWNRASRRLRDPAVRGFLTVMSGDRGAGSLHLHRYRLLRNSIPGIDQFDRDHEWAVWGIQRHLERGLIIALGVGGGR